MVDWLERRARVDVARRDEYAEDAPAYPGATTPERTYMSVLFSFLRVASLVG